MTWTLSSRWRLNGGVEIPILGLGVYNAKPGEETRTAVRAALEHGYRHIDTAKIYGNERDVGRAVRESGVPREDVFLTTKLWNGDHGYDATLRAFEQSRVNLGVETIDLYLIHWPVTGLRKESWRALETLLGEGRCRAIGVSNFTIRHLEDLLDGAKVVPAVNQVEWSPFLYQEHLLRYCQRHEIRLEAYSPLTRGRRLAHPTVVEVARRVGRTPAQVLIRWVMQHDVVVIPKSAHPDRIRENAQVFDFELGAEDMRILDGLDEGLRTAWNPSDVP